MILRSLLMEKSFQLIEGCFVLQVDISEVIVANLNYDSFLSPPVHIALWGLMCRFLSVCPSVNFPLNKNSPQHNAYIYFFLVKILITRRVTLRVTLKILTL